MAEQNQDDEQQKTLASKTTQTATAAKSGSKQRKGTGEEPTPGGVHRPGRPPGEFTDSGPVSMPVTRTR